MRVILFLSMLYGLHAATAGCLTYTCGALESGICARVYNGVITINNSTCPSGSYCSYVDSVQWIATAASVSTSTTTSYNSLYSCKSGEYELQPTNDDYLSCPYRPLLKDLMDGSFPKECTQPGTNDPACQLQDSTFSLCGCGLDGKAYCVPSIGASIYDDYWEECTTTSFRGSLSSIEHWRYWSLKMSLYLPYMTGYSCCHKIFSEFSTIDELQYSAFGQHSAVPLVLLVALISG